MYTLLNDYSILAHPRILQAVGEANATPEQGYYEDSHSQRARALLRRELGETDAEIHFMPGGTLTNLIAMSAFLRPQEAVISSRDCHMYTHEAGAIEANGHKILPIETEDGKITPRQIQAVLDEHEGMHMVVPALVAISNSTELGTLYTKEELVELHTFCREKELFLYCDGARLAMALAKEESQLSLADMVRYTDAFYIGGTKNGALLGEALVLTHPLPKKGFCQLAKQKGGFLAKGTLVGVQFETLFEENLFYALASQANQKAARLADGLRQKGIPILYPPQTNQVFPILPLEKVRALEEKFLFMRWKPCDQGHVIRLVTSWATEEGSIDAFLAAI